MKVDLWCATLAHRRDLWKKLSIPSLLIRVAAKTAREGRLCTPRARNGQYPRAYYTPYAQRILTHAQFGESLLS